MGLLDDDGPPPQGDPMEMLRLLLTKGAPPMSDADFASLFTPPSLLAALRRLPGYGAPGGPAPGYDAPGYGASGYGAPSPGPMSAPSPFGMSVPGPAGATPPFGTTPSWPWAAASQAPGASAPETPPEPRPRGLLDPDPGRGLLGVTLDEPPPRLPTYAELFDSARRGVPYGLPDGSGAYASGTASPEAPPSSAAPRGLGLLEIDPHELGQPSPLPAWRALSPDHAPWVRRLGGLLGVFPEGEEPDAPATPSHANSYTALRANPDGAQDGESGGYASDTLTGAGGNNDHGQVSADQLAQHMPVEPTYRDSWREHPSTFYDMERPVPTLPYPTVGPNGRPRFDLDLYRDYVRNLQDLGPNAINGLANSYAFEGGDRLDFPNAAARRSRNIDAASRFGIASHTFHRYRDQAGLGHVERPADLTPSEAAQFNRWYINKGLERINSPNSRAGISRLEEIQDSPTSTMFQDTFIRHGWVGGSRIVEKAIADTLHDLPPDAKANPRLREIEARYLVGVMGTLRNAPDPAANEAIGRPTFEVFRDLANAGYGDQLRQNLKIYRDNDKSTDWDRLRTTYFVERGRHPIGPLRSRRPEEGA